MAVVGVSQTVIEMTAAREKYYYLLLSPSIKKNLVHDPLLYLLYTGSEERQAECVQ